MKQLLTLSVLAAALFFAQPVQAQQQNNQAENMYHQMEMMPDSSMQSIMRMMMNNAQVRRMAIRLMEQKRMSDSTMMSGRHGMMMNGGMMGMMKKCMQRMKMKQGNMNMDMNHMRQDSMKMKDEKNG